MFNLIKSEMLRILHDKCFIIALVLLVFFPFFETSIYLVLSQFVEKSDPIVSLTFQAISYDSLTAMFKPFSDFNLIILVLTSFLLGYEYTNGTIRNKIISGFSRIKVFFSFFISILVFGLVMAVGYSLLSTLLSTIFFGFASDGVQKAVLSICYNFVAYISCFGFVCLLVHLFKGFKYAFLSLIGVLFATQFVSTIIDVVYTLVDNPAIKYISLAIPFTESQYLFDSTGTYIFSLSMSIIYAILFTGLGLLRFMKSDIK